MVREVLLHLSRHCHHYHPLSYLHPILPYSPYLPITRYFHTPPYLPITRYFHTPPYLHITRYFYTPTDLHINRDFCSTCYPTIITHISCGNPRTRSDPIGGSELKPRGRPIEAINQIRLSNTFHSQIFAETILI